LKRKEKKKKGKKKKERQTNSRRKIAEQHSRVGARRARCKRTIFT
jgi:hypothetical protein